MKEKNKGAEKPNQTTDSKVIISPRLGVPEWQPSASVSPEIKMQILISQWSGTGKLIAGNSQNSLSPNDGRRITLPWTVLSLWGWSSAPDCSLPRTKSLTGWKLFVGFCFFKFPVWLFLSSVCFMFLLRLRPHPLTNHFPCFHFNFLIYSFYFCITGARLAQTLLTATSTAASRDALTRSLLLSSSLTYLATDPVPEQQFSPADSLVLSHQQRGLGYLLLRVLEKFFIEYTQPDHEKPESW